MNITTGGGILILLILVGTGGGLYQAHLAEGKNLTSQEFTIMFENSTTNLNNISNQFTPKPLNVSNLNNNPIYQQRIVRIIYKQVDAFIFSTIEFAKLSIEFGYNNQIEGKEIINWVKIMIYVIVIVTLLPILFPLLACLYLIGQFFKWIYKKIKNKGDKK